MNKKEKKINIFNKINDTYLKYPKDKMIHELFEEQVMKTPARTALICEKEKINYEDLNKKANKLAHYLIDNGVQQGSIIGLIINPSIEMIISILAVLKVGATYLPIDITNTKERISQMINDSNVFCVLTKSKIYKEFNLSVKFIDVDGEKSYSTNDLNISIPQLSESIAYIVFTSGSTGKPKGVMISHKSIVNLIFGINKSINITENKRILSHTSIAFDIFILETLLPLCLGLEVLMVPNKLQKNPKLLATIIREEEIDIIQITPSQMSMFISCQEGRESLQTTFLKKILVGGESFPNYLLNELKKLTTAKIYNMYGPSETTVWSTYHEVTDEETLSIGKPIANTRIYILDKNNVELKAGEPGELCIAGDGLAVGYLNNEELTSYKFINHPSMINERLYKTGDIVKINNEGNIDYLGRLDNQIKLKGHRIELEEIESLILSTNIVKEVIVVTKETMNNGTFLIAYITNNTTVNVNKLKDILSLIIPEYMIPSKIIQIDSFPLNINGKADRIALSKLSIPTTESFVDYDLLANHNPILIGIKEILKDEFEEYINVSIEVLDINATFDTFGIDSLNFIKMIVLIEEKFDITFDDEMLDYNISGTLNKLTNIVEELKGRII